MPASEPDARARLPLSTKLAYGFGTVAFGVKDQAFSSLLLIYYNQVIGLPAATVGFAILIALVVDSLLDPLVGQISDNWRSPWGRRHPFMYAAALPAALSFLLLWNPPDWPQPALVAYLVVVAVVIRSFITLYEIPSSALAPELTQDYDERTRVFAFRNFFGWVGGVGMTVLALQVFLRPDADHPVGQLNPEGYQTYAIAAAITILVAILTSAVGTHRHIPRLRVPPKRRLTLGGMMREMIGTLANRSFMVLAGAALFNAMAHGLVLSMSLYLGTFFWQLTSSQIAVLASANFVSAILALSLAAPVSRGPGKRNAARRMKWISLALAAAPISLRILDVFPRNGDPLLLPALFAFSTLATASTIITTILVSSMVADVVESSELKTGRRSEGLFFAFNAFVAKVVSGVGIFTSAAILALIGFPRGASPGAVDATVIDRLGISYVVVLGGLYAGAIACISLYRITRADHDAAVRELAAARTAAPGE